MWAARAWVAGEFADQTAQKNDAADDALADARRWGFDEAGIMDLRIALGQRPGNRLWHMHVNAFRALVAGMTQWRTRLVFGERGLSERVVGLDYAGLKVALEAIGLQLDADDWGRLMVLESAAAAAFNGEVM